MTAQKWTTKTVEYRDTCNKVDLDQPDEKSDYEETIRTRSFANKKVAPRKRLHRRHQRRRPRILPVRVSAVTNVLKVIPCKSVIIKFFESTQEAIKMANPDADFSWVLNICNCNFNALSQKGCKAWSDNSPTYCTSVIRCCHCCKQT